MGARPDRPQAPLVVLAHAADRTGAPVTLLHQLRWLRRHADWPLVVVLLRDGPLLDQFSSLGEVVVIGEPDLNPIRSAALEAADRRRRRLLAHLRQASLVYINTAWSVHALSFLPSSLDAPVIAAIHELDHDLRDALSPVALDLLLHRPDHLVAGAEVIAENLVTGYGVIADRITVVPEAIELPAPHPPTRRLRPDDVLVVAVGSPTWRKAPDLFVQVADRVRRIDPRLTARFRWVGADPAAGHPDLVTPLADRDRLGLTASVEFVAPTDDVDAHLREADIFLLPSREDASPLVCLEAAAHELPVVAFDNGGIPGLLGPEGCISVPYPDLHAMAEHIVALARDPDERRRRGQAGARVVRSRHDIEVTGPLLAEVLRRWAR